MKTLGSRIPSVTSKNDKCELPNVGLKVVRDTGTHPVYVHVEIKLTVWFATGKLPPLNI
jgi:predicted RNA binding protein YcfA (HicA-like mRNA interferase family)